MCDTIFASSETTLRPVSLFGKNSDRQRNEAQLVEIVPAGEYSPGTQLTCSYITIPQALRTHAVMLCRPFWTWGAEMGSNEHGVVIGNEGLHARGPAPQGAALTGMDLVRLALERASTAREASEVIIALLEHYGQGGNCGHLTPSYYHNGFLIADSSEAFVLETVDSEWILESAGGIRTLSNIYSIGSRATSTSVGVPGLVREYGWNENSTPDYARAISNPDREHIGQAGARRARSASLLTAREGRLDVADIMSVLRDHGTLNPPERWHPRDSAVISLCMHAGAGGRVGQTVGSLVSEMSRKGAAHWVTATAAPCMSIYKPVLMDVGLPTHGPRPTDAFDARTLWWRHEQLHRAAVEGDFQGFLNEIREERDALEASFRARVGAVLNGGSRADRSRIVAECWKQAIETEQGWSARTSSAVEASDNPYSASWLEMNRLSGMAQCH